ncbi:hypothetical protein [Azospirillum sp. sgz301742]
MPRKTNIDYLEPGPAPDVFPWRFLSTRQLAKWLNVSQNSLMTWRLRGNGPRFGKDSRGRCWYRACEVAAWMRRGEQSPEEICREFVAARFPKVTVPDGLPLADTIPWLELQDKTRVFSPKDPGRFPRLKYES